MPLPRKRLLSVELLEDRVVPASLVSVNLAGTNSGNAQSGDHNLFLASDISTDGRYIAFLSEASDITNPSGASSPMRAVYVRDLQTNTTELASEGFDVFSFDMSDNGQFVAFYAGTTLYIRDLVNNTTNTAVTEVGGGGLGFDVFISPNGRTVAFQDDTPLTTGFVAQFFVYDSQTSQVHEITGGTASSGVDNVEFSADGTKVLFDTSLSGGPTDTNGFHDTFLYDLTTETTTLISAKADGTGTTTTGSLLADISADGKRVLFFSEGTGLDASMPAQASSKRNLYVRDLNTNTTTVLSVDTANTFSGGAFAGANITPDGKYALWRSFYDLLVTGSGGQSIIFRKNIDTGELIRVDLRPDGGNPNGSNTLTSNLTGNIPNPDAISDDGRYVTFMSNSTNLVNGYVAPGAGVFEVYVRDIVAGVTHLASNSTAGAVNGGGDAATNGGDFPVLSGDGSVVTFYSKATNLVSSDSNGARDVFAFEVPVVTIDTAGARITAATFSGTAPNTFDKVRLTFSEAMQPATVNTTNITLAGPGGAITITSIAAVSGSNNTQFDVTFAPQLAFGDYTLNAGVDMLDVAGNQMNQNQDGTNGQGEVPPVGDQFSVTATLSAAPDTTGPRVTAAAFSGSATSFDTVLVTFNEAIDPTSFTVADVTLTGPNGTIAATTVTPVTGSSTEFIVAFSAQTTLGSYSIIVGPNVTDVAGNAMDQNQNGTEGETPNDQFTTSDTLDPLPPFVAVGNKGGTARIVNSDTGAVISTIRPLDNAGKQYTGIVAVALGDFNGDDIPDLVVSATDPVGLNGLSSAKAGKVFVYDGAALVTGTVPANPFRTFIPFATTSGPAGTTGAFTNGLNIATGDVNGDGTVDLIAGTRGITAGVGRAEFGRLVVIDGTSPAGTNVIVGGIQTPFGAGYQKGVVVAAGNVDGTGGDEIAVTRGGPVNSKDVEIQKIKVKVLQLQGASLAELKLAADGSTSFAPFGSLTGPANAIKRDGRVAFVDADGDGKDELVFTALDPLTNPSSQRVRVGVYAIDPTATSGAATIVSTGSDAGTYLTGSGVIDHAITHVHATGTVENLALLTESSSSGIAYLDALTGAVQPGGFALSVLNGGITIDGV